MRKLSVVSNSSLHLVQNSRDAESPLKKVTYPGTGNHSDFTYDPFSRCIKIVETRSGSVSDTKQFVWVGGKIRETRDASSALTAQYFTRGEKVGSTINFYTKDHLGSIREKTDNSGAINSQLAYSPWGEPTLLQGASLPQFTYGGMYAHDPSKLNLTWFRQYSASSARWLNRDPFGESQGTNLFGYVGNNPISYVDPSGQSLVAALPFIAPFVASPAVLIVIGGAAILGTVWAAGQILGPSTSGGFGSGSKAGLPANSGGSSGSVSMPSNSGGKGAGIAPPETSGGYTAGSETGSLGGFTPTDAGLGTSCPVKAPGYPGDHPNSGFVPPKKNAGKLVQGKGGWGYLDAAGNLWV